VSTRAFVALDLDARVRDAAAELIETLRPRARSARFVSPDAIHLTLRFLGSSEPEQLDALAGALSVAAAACPPSIARVSGLGTFPGRGSPRVLWLGLDLPAPVLALQRDCERAAVGAGFEPEDREFHPHVTLARFKARVPRPELPPCDLGECPLQTLVLYRSDLRREGAVHTPLGTWRLGAGLD